MSGVPGADDEAAAIHAEFAEDVSYTGAGLTAQTVAAVRSDVAADVFQGAGSTLRETSFEVQIADLPDEPAKGDVIEEADNTRWRVIDVTLRSDVDAWLLIVEAAA